MLCCLDHDLQCGLDSTSTSFDEVRLPVEGDQVDSEADDLVVTTGRTTREVPRLSTTTKPWGAPYNAVAGGRDFRCEIGVCCWWRFGISGTCRRRTCLCVARRQPFSQCVTVHDCRVRARAWSETCTQSFLCYVTCLFLDGMVLELMLLLFFFGDVQIVSGFTHLSDSHTEPLMKALGSQDPFF